MAVLVTADHGPAWTWRQLAGGSLARRAEDVDGRALRRAMTDEEVAWERVPSPAWVSATFPPSPRPSPTCAFRARERELRRRQRALPLPPHGAREREPRGKIPPNCPRPREAWERGASRSEARPRALASGRVRAATGTASGRGIGDERSRAWRRFGKKALTPTLSHLRLTARGRGSCGGANAPCRFRLTARGRGSCGGAGVLAPFAFRRAGARGRGSCGGANAPCRFRLTARGRGSRAARSRQTALARAKRWEREGTHVSGEGEGCRSVART